MIKKIGTVLLVAIIGFAISLWVISEPRPEGISGAKAESLARKMLQSLNAPAWDSLDMVSWNFKGIHDYHWDRKNEKVTVSWDGWRVVLDLTKETGIVYQNNTEVNDDAIVKKALTYFYNDSFWLCAPFKIYDPGTARSLVATDEGDALLVTFNQGGVTPGDAYLWYLDEKGFPYKYKMWVKIIPIGGLSFTWEDWRQFDGIWLAQNHKGLINVALQGITVGNGPEVR